MLYYLYDIKWESVLEQIKIASLYELARQHKKNCSDRDCTISMIALGMIYRELVKRELNAEEVLLFC